VKILRLILLAPIALIISGQIEAQTAVKPTLEEARRIAVEQHPQIMAALLTARAAHQVPSQIRAAKYPNLVANMTSAGAGENTTIAAGALNNSSVLNRAATGLSLNQLLFDFGRNNSLVENSRSRANAVEQTAAATRAQIIIQIVRDVRVAWLNADLARERYRLGLSSIVELSQALLSVTVAEIENANAKFEYLIQRSALNYQSGRLR